VHDGVLEEVSQGGVRFYRRSAGPRLVRAAGENEA
jgi:hypothetical protein